MPSYLSKTKRKGLRKAPQRYVATREEMSMIEMFESFMAFKQTEGLSKFTLDDYYTHFRWFMEYAQTDVSRSEMTVELFRGYISYMLNDLGVTPVTVNLRIRTLRAFLRHSYNEGLLDTPIHEKFKPMKTDQEQIEAFTPSEVKRLLNVIDDTLYVGFRDRAMIYVMLDTLVRASELLNMKRENVDLKNGLIRLEAGQTKTKRSRDVPISAYTIKLLRQYIQETEDFNEDLLFLTYDGKQIASNTWRKRLLDLAEKANIHNKRVSQHTFRHTGALFYIMNGGDPFSLQKILGHTDMSMVKRYIQMSSTDIKRQHNSYTPLKSVLKTK
ncbi:integrase [Fictibacillus phosphorivorans]|uniref:Integrase n=1 Tax=Fictibacillus phosphorivorans TaxID=1221500 RepID=A0A163R016_9BACL|nr:tyrosine-type recombinase/integrase [Fictibacillus phosphorivorans]KZE65989.1 integrase [Fictibacillus phosphorivorans]